MPNKILNLFKIKVLSEVCKTNSYKMASQTLFITPSAVSKIIKDLEADWNVALVQSTGNNIRTTPQAAQLYAYATRLLQANDDFTEQLDLLNEHNSAVLHIGSGASYTRVMMNKFLVSVLKTYPELEYDVITKNSADIVKLVSEGAMDCGIVSGEIPVEVDKVLIYNDTISLYAHSSHSLANQSVSLANVNYPICFREKGSSTRYYVEQFLQEQNIRLINIKQTGKNDELTDFLCKTEGAMQFMSDFYYQNSIWNKEYIRIYCAEVVIPAPVYFISRKNFPFLKLMKHIGKKTFQQEFLAP